MSAERFTEIGLDVDDGVATIVLDRPERLNAVTTTMVDELVAAFDATDRDDAVRAVVLTGAGRAFCAGADLADGARAFENAEAREGEAFARDLGGVLVLRIAASIKPVIVAVGGAAVGLGATMMLPADVRLAADTARFGFVFTRRGIVPDGASSWFLPRVVGISRASEWVVTGRLVDAEEALAGGLVSRVLPAAELLPAAVALAREIAAHTSPTSVALSRRMLWSMLDAPSPWDAHRLDSHVLSVLARGGDAAEGVASFLEKRPPRFSPDVTTHRDLVPPWPTAPPTR